MNHEAYLNVCFTIYWTPFTVRDTVNPTPQLRPRTRYFEHNTINSGVTNRGLFLDYLRILDPEAGLTNHMEHIPFSFGLFNL
jgi:hypothetical protein